MPKKRLANSDRAVIVRSPNIPKMEGKVGIVRNDDGKMYYLLIEGEPGSLGIWVPHADVMWRPPKDKTPTAFDGSINGRPLKIFGGTVPVKVINRVKDSRGNEYFGAVGYPWGRNESTVWMKITKSASGHPRNSFLRFPREHFASSITALHEKDTFILGVILLQVNEASK